MLVPPSCPGQCLLPQEGDATGVGLAIPWQPVAEGGDACAVCFWVRSWAACGGRPRPGPLVPRELVPPCSCFRAGKGPCSARLTFMAPRASLTLEGPWASASSVSHSPACCEVGAHRGQGLPLTVGCCSQPWASVVQSAWAQLPRSGGQALAGVGGGTSAGHCLRALDSRPTGSTGSCRSPCPPQSTPLGTLQRDEASLRGRVVSWQVSLVPHKNAERSA